MAAAVSQSDEDQLLAALNDAWAGMKVTPSYNIVYSIAGSSFHLTSADGSLAVVSLTTPAALKAAMAECGTHVVVEKEEDLFALRTADKFQKAITDRKILVHGDGSQVRALCKEIAISEDRANAALKRKASELGLRLLSDSAEPEKTSLALAPGEQVGTTVIGADGLLYEMNLPGQLMQRLWQWVHFSAFSTLLGNMGQTNYTAANAYLDMITWESRTSQNIVQPMTYMWGAVTGIGMRLKAFGSQDALMFSDEDVLFTVDDAAMTLRCMLNAQTPPEWYNGSLLDRATKAAIEAMNPKKGDGAAVSLGEDIIFDPSSEKLRVLPREDEDRVKTMKIIQQSSATRSSKPEPEQQRHEEPCPHIIAGSWDNFTPHAFPWDDKRECFAFKLQIGASGSESFQVCKGKPTGRRVKTAGKSWRVGARDAGARYEVRMFLKENGTARKVEWEKLSKSSAATVPAPATAEGAALDALLEELWFRKICACTPAERAAA